MSVTPRYSGRWQKVLCFCIVLLSFCCSNVCPAKDIESSSSTGKYKYIYGDRLLTEKGIFNVINSAGPDYSKALLLLETERKSSQHIFIATGLTGGLALIAGAILIGIGDGHSAAMIGSGIALTASGAITLGLGTYYSLDRRKQANRHLVEIINHFNEEHEMRIVPSFGMNKTDIENTQIKEKIIRLSLQF